MDKIYKFFEFLEKKEKRDIPGKLKLIYDPNYKFDIKDFEDIGGNINLKRIKKDFNLPDNLKVRGGLYLQGSSITSLPDNLEVGRDLELGNCTSLESLPDNLSVGLDLGAIGSSIKSMHGNLKVGGSLWLNTTNIKSLPDNLSVGRDLYLIYTPINSLPDNLKVGRDLYLSYTPINSLPDNLKVGGNLVLDLTPLATKLQGKSQEELNKMFPNVKGRIFI